MILDFERDGEMMTMKSYGDMFCHPFSRLFDVLSYVVKARQNGRGISHFRRAETTSFHRPNRRASKSSMIKLRVKVQKVRKYVTQQLV